MKNNYFMQNCSKKLLLDHLGIFSFFVAIILGLSACEKPMQLIPQTETEESHLKAAVAEEEYFHIVVLPDAQYYTSLKYGGTMNMFHYQLDWIINNKTSSKIAYVITLGDMSDHGDDVPIEFTRGGTEMYRLETANIPYGTAVGNHEETSNRSPESGGNDQYANWFGRYHMETKSWYGGAYGSSNNNDNHYDLFTACGTDFIVLYIEYNAPNNTLYNPTIANNVMNWADGVLNTYSSRKAIIVSHSILNRPVGSESDYRGGNGNNNVASTFTDQGNAIYNRMKLHPNVFLMLCGHISGEGLRQDTYNGTVIKSYLSDYQNRQDSPYGGESDRNGGNGFMRLMKFSITNQTLSVRTVAPRPGDNILETDGDSQFSKPLYN